jgi:hypothetical protein
VTRLMKKDAFSLPFEVMRLEETEAFHNPTKRSNSMFSLILMTVGILLGYQGGHSKLSAGNVTAECSADELMALIDNEAQKMKASIKDEYDSDIIFKYAQQFDTCNMSLDAEEPLVFLGAEGRRAFAKFPVKLTLRTSRTETGAIKICVSRTQLAGDREPKTECKTH